MTLGISFISTLLVYILGILPRSIAPPQMLGRFCLLHSRPLSAVSPIHATRSNILLAAEKKMEKCLVIRVNHRDPLSIRMKGMHGVRTVGVVDGCIWAMASTPTVDETFTSYRWADKTIKYPGSVSISIANNIDPTPPESSENETIEGLQRKIEKGFEELKKFEIKAKCHAPRRATCDHVSQRPRTAKVFLNGKQVYETSGEHIQFQVDINPEEECVFSIYNRIHASDERPASKYHVQLSEETEILMRLGS